MLFSSKIRCRKQLFLQIKYHCLSRRLFGLWPLRQADKSLRTQLERVILMRTNLLMVKNEALSLLLRLDCAFDWKSKPASGTGFIVHDDSMNGSLLRIKDPCKKRRSRYLGSPSMVPLNYDTMQRFIFPWWVRKKGSDSVFPHRRLWKKLRLVEKLDFHTSIRGLSEADERFPEDFVRLMPGNQGLVVQDNSKER